MCEYHSEQIGELAKALAAAQRDLNPAQKNASNPMLRNRYADLSSCIAATREVLPAHGLAVSQIVEPTDGSTVAVTTMLMHESGQWLKGRCVLPVPSEHKGINAAQAAGSYITYARRYGLSAIVGLATDDDDDGCGAQRPQERQQRTPAKAPARQQASSSPTPTEEQRAQAKEVWDRLERLGFQSKEDRLGELGRLVGKPVQRSADLAMEDLTNILSLLDAQEATTKEF